MPLSVYNNTTYKCVLYNNTTYNVSTSLILISGKRRLFLYFFSTKNEKFILVAARSIFFWIFTKFFFHSSGNEILNSTL